MKQPKHKVFRKPFCFFRKASAGKRKPQTPRFSLESGLLELNRCIQRALKTKPVVVIGITGGSGSGKTHIAKKIRGKLLSMDDYHKGIGRSGQNFERPQALDIGLLKEHLKQLRKGKPIKKPVYDFTTHSRTGYEEFLPGNIILVEGVFALTRKLASQIDLKVFVESPAERRLERRIERDIRERGRTKESVIKQVTERVEPMHKKYVEPSKKRANIIIEN